MDTPRTTVSSNASAPWFVLALSAITLGGLFALAPLLARVPLINELIPDPLFSKRLLVVHVNLALGVWFYSFICVLFHQLPGTQQKTPISRGLFGLATLGVIAFVITLGFRDALPLLNNYVPTLDSTLFRVGLFTFWFCVALNFFRPSALAPTSDTSLTPAPARIAIFSAAICYLLAMVTLAGTYLNMPDQAPPFEYYEHLFWGPGHVLQFANECAMVAAWLILLTKGLGRSPISAKTALLLFTLFVLPLLLAPYFAFSEANKHRYTQLMQWGIFPIVTIILGLCIAACIKALRSGQMRFSSLFKTPAFTGFAASALLTVIGFILGALIETSTTLVPAHYHASIGAVTVSYMAVSYLLLESWGIPVPTLRLKRISVWQPLLFGMGQFIMAGGLAIAGYYGNAARKVYGTEQHVRTPAEYVGLWVMGIGGILAIIGGILFLTIVIRSYRASKRPPDRTETLNSSDSPFPYGTSRRG